jgi:hypothetical protein
MREFGPNAPLPPTGLPAAPEVTEAREPSAACDGASRELLVVSHEQLFAEAPSSRCDACGDPLLGEDDASDGYEVPGRGVYLWARGEETRLESVPLCASCASAIGMTALARWEIEEEEG